MSVIAALLIALQGVPASVVTDPPRDAAHPARHQQLLIPSGGVGMNALMMRASGAGPKPLLVIFHGLPGNERNLDLAQAVRRSGWNVLTFSYRGAFGSPGAFSFANAVEDADAVAAFLRSPGIAETYGFDPKRIVFAGHSMGGFAAAMHARHDPALAGLVLLDTADIGARGAAARTAGVPVATIAKNFDDLGNILAGATPTSLATELLAAPPVWNLDAGAAALKAMPTLVIGASAGLARESDAIVGAIRAAGNARVTAQTMTTDHSFSDHRIALAGAVVTWLEQLPR